MQQPLEALKTAVIKAVYSGGSPTPGSGTLSALNNAVFRLLKTMTVKSQRRPNTTLANMVYNLVLDTIKTKEYQDKLGPKKPKPKPLRTSGTVIIINAKLCRLVEENKLTVFTCYTKVNAGDRGTYQLTKQGIVVTITFRGSAKVAKDRNYSSCNCIVKSDLDFNKLDFRAIPVTVTETGLEEIILKASSNSEFAGPTCGPVWFRTEFVYAYIDKDNNYVESGAKSGTPINNINKRLLKIDLTGLYTVMPKPVRMVFYGKYTFIIMAKAIPQPDWANSNDIYYLWMHDLLIINTQDLTVTQLVGADETDWTVLPRPAGFHVGYVDIQLDKVTGNLLLLKTGFSRVEQTFDLDLYIKGDPEWALEPATPPTIYPKVVGVSYTLDEVALNGAGTGLTVVQNKYTHNGINNTIKGITLIGCVTSTMFTQVPVTGEIFINRHSVGYEQIGLYPPELVRDDYHDYPSRDYSVNALGSWQICTAEGTILHEVLSNYCGHLRIIFSDYPDVGPITDYMFMAKIEATDWQVRTILDIYPQLDDDTYPGLLCFYHVDNMFGYSKIDQESLLPGRKIGSIGINKDSNLYDGVYFREGHFLALKDSITEDIKFIWAARRRLITASITEFGFQTQQGYFFFKEDWAVREGGILDATGMDKSQIAGGFLEPDVPMPPVAPDTTELASYLGFIDGSMVQVSPNEVYFVVSRFERSLILGWPSLKVLRFQSSEHLSYVGYVKAEDGYMWGGHFLDAEQNNFMLTGMFSLPKLLSEAGLVASACPESIPKADLG